MHCIALHCIAERTTEVDFRRQLASAINDERIRIESTSAQLSGEADGESEIESNSDCAVVPPSIDAAQCDNSDSDDASLD